MADLLSDAERKLAIMHDVLNEIKDELQDGWYEEALANLKGKGRRKITPPDEFYDTEFPNVIEEPKQ